LGSDLSWLAGEEGGFVKVMAIDGANTAISREMGGPADVGIAGYVARHRAPFTTHDYLSDSRISHSSFIDNALTEEEIKSVIGVPIISDHQVIGVLIICDRYKRTYQAWEISTLATLAAHAAVAIQSARNHEIKTRALEAERVANTKLEERIKALEISTQAHEQLSQLLAKGASLSDLLRVISAILDGQVTFLDPAGQTLAVARMNREASHGDEAQSRTALIGAQQLHVESEESRRTGRSIEVSVRNSNAWERLMAVSSGDEYIGYLVIQTQRRLEDTEVRVFERCSNVLAVIKLLEDRRFASVRQSIRLTVRALLDESQCARRSTLDQASHFGLATDCPVCLAVISVDRSKAAHLVQVLSEKLDTEWKLVADLDEQVVVISNALDQQTLREKLEKIIFREARCKALAVWSYPLSDQTLLPEQFRRSSRLISLLNKLGRENAVVLEPEFNIYTSFFEDLSPERIEHMIDAAVGPLVRHDEVRQTLLCRTLLAFLDHGQNAKVTAERLNVHVNTVHNRLEAIESILGDWRSHGRTLDIHLALQLSRLRHGV
jgi:sugar diacid utilization regulator